MKFEIAYPAPKLPKTLTFAFHRRKKEEKADKVCRAFPGRNFSFTPVKPHLSGENGRKSLPETLTFAGNGKIPANPEAPNYPLPNLLTFGQLEQNGKRMFAIVGRRKPWSAPEKSHLRRSSARI